MARVRNRSARKLRSLPFDAAAIANARQSALPEHCEPQIATLADEVPTEDGWVFETKLEGLRLLAWLDGPRVKLRDRYREEWTLPVLEKELASFAPQSALLDGQLVALLPDGTTSFRKLQEAVGQRGPAQLVYQAFDLLHVDGYDLKDVELVSRKKALKALLTAGGVMSNRGAIRYVHHFEGNGADLFEELCRLGLAGIVCKVRTARYRSGPSGDWIEVDCAAHAAQTRERNALQSASAHGMRFALQQWPKNWRPGGGTDG